MRCNRHPKEGAIISAPIKKVGYERKSQDRDYGACGKDEAHSPAAHVLAQEGRIYIRRKGILDR